MAASDPDSLPAPPAYHSPAVPEHPPPPYKPPAPSPGEESSSDDEEIQYRDDDEEPSMYLCMFFQYRLAHSLKWSTGLAIQRSVV